MNYGKIDISLTAISSRMDSVCDTLGSLLAQDYRDVQIHLYLSREPYLLDKGVPELPAPLKDLMLQAGERLAVHYCLNTGPYRKLVPYLRENWGTSRLVVTVDDDTIYPPDWLSTLVQAYDTYGCVVAYRGHRILVNQAGIAPYRTWMRSVIEENPSHLVIPTGKDGILYDTAFFPIGVLNMDDALELAPTADDLWFRWHLSMNRINTYIISTDYRAGSFTESDYESSLFLNFNREGRNDIAIAALEEYFHRLYRFSLAGKSAA